MNTHTILNIKTDKKLKSDAKQIAAELGVPLSTVVNSFLKQFVRDKEVTFSTIQYKMTHYLEDLVKDAQTEYAAGKIKTFNSADDFMADLNK